MNKEGILVSGNADGNVSLWKTGSGKRVYQISEKDNQILCLDYNCLGSHFATAGTDFQAIFSI